MVKKMAKVMVNELPLKIKLIEWISGRIHSVTFVPSITFEFFLSMVKEEINVEFASPMSVFALYPPSYSLASKKRLDESNYMSIFIDFRNGLSIPKFYVIAQKDSPSGSPHQAVNASNDISSVTTSTSHRIGQEDFTERVLNRDMHACVFCSLNDKDTPLYGAHIFGHREYNSISSNVDRIEYLRKLSLNGINETSNGITLCWNCHQAFDNYLVCIDPESSILLVTEALQEHEPIKWKPLNGKSISPGSFYWPSKELMAYRFDKMKEKQEERAKQTETYPFRCRSCGVKLKSLRGMTGHFGSQKCTRSGMAKYSTPGKENQVDEALLDEEIGY